MSFTDVLVDLAEKLRLAGLNASIDPVEVTPPGVVVRADAALPGSAKLCGDYPMRVVLWLVAPDTTTLAAYRALDDLYGRTLAALAGTGTTPTPDERVFQRLVMPDDPTGLPALRVPTITIVPALAAVSTGRNTP